MLNKITLIEPKAPGAHVYSTVNMPRLGLPQLGSVLRSKGYQVKIFFEKSGEIELPALLDSDLVGISIITSTSTEGYRIARFLREKGMPVIIGGPHATFMPEEALNYADYVIRGEGESAILPLLEAIGKGAAPLGIPGVSYILDGEPVHNPPPPCAEDLNSLPSPDLSLFVNMGKLSTVPVLTSRGCPFNCTFCSVN
ncbi:MAG: hypothetical protein GX764_01650, partial [Firmicutes bacterium]|nr:hypothetical protein [Bacillota bacterium]